MKSVCEFMCALTVQCVCLCVCGCVICILSNNLSNLCSFSQCQHGFCFRSIAGNQPSKSAANSWFTLWKWKQTIRFSHICICKEAHSERYKYFNLFWHSRDSIENLKKEKKKSCFMMFWVEFHHSQRQQRSAPLRPVSHRASMEMRVIVKNLVMDSWPQLRRISRSVLRMTVEQHRGMRRKVTPLAFIISRCQKTQLF